MDGSDDVKGTIEIDAGDEEKTLYGVLRGFVADVSGGGGGGSPPMASRIRASLAKTAPDLREASRNSAHDLLRWTRQGSPLRAALVVSVGTIMLLALAGLSVFMLFFVAAMLNAVIISALMSLAAAGGFLALFFACLTAIYIGAFSVAVIVISATTFTAIIAVAIATGWIGFFWIVWMAAKKSMDLSMQLLNTASSSASVRMAPARLFHDAPQKSSIVEAS
ncbi:uncharacterized protein M6B38_272820 [Iris pallida]|uniref:Uncharacterized protein n=1 Tax=Iris pallida TaxID=29817 RepID=A0AAX6I750_IRIPA|nr:uncharacterized protein M6B38_381300 [Iris pallida]KAJ6848763.1 uncharacterized protein M6B38_272820 [Iris pallida]